MTGIVKQNIRNRTAWKQEQVHKTMKHRKEQKKKREVQEQLKLACKAIIKGFDALKNAIKGVGEWFKTGLKQATSYLSKYKSYDNYYSPPKDIINPIGLNCPDLK
jgi:hypothetical protein